MVQVVKEIEFRILIINFAYEYFLNRDGFIDLEQIDETLLN